jgi:hypothetical protein
MAIPTVPLAHFIVIQTGFAFDFLETLFDGVAGGGHPRQFRQRDVGGRIGQVAVQSNRRKLRHPPPNASARQLARRVPTSPSQVLRRLCTRLFATKYVVETGAKGEKVSALLVQFFRCHQPSDGMILPPLSAQGLTV